MHGGAWSFHFVCHMSHHRVIRIENTVSLGYESKDDLVTIHNSQSEIVS
jgi:hypothetical protein